MDKKLFITLVGVSYSTNLIITEDDAHLHQKEVERCQNLLEKEDCDTSVSATLEIWQSKFADLVNDSTELFVVKDKEDVITMVANNFPELFILDAGVQPKHIDSLGLGNWSKDIISELPKAEDAAKKYLEDNGYKVIQEDDIKFELTSDPTYAESLAPGAVGASVSADVLDRISELVRKFGSWQPILDHLEKM